MHLTESQINSLVDKVVARLGNPRSQIKSGMTETAFPSIRPTLSVKRNGTFDNIDEAVAAAEVAHHRLLSMTLEQRDKIISNIRKKCLDNIESLSKGAQEETGLGRWQDKVTKNKLVITKTPGTEILTPYAKTGDFGLVLEERAPYGVIGSITPCTNPTETIINNGIGMIAGGNAVVFNPHPMAKNVSSQCIEVINKAVVEAGGPENLFVCISNPTIETAGELMKHPHVKLLVVTGGGGVVKAAMASGKKTIAAGPGNPPVLVDETADIDRAGRHIMKGASLDNNIICIAEKETLVVDKVADELIKAMKKYNCFIATPSQIKEIEDIVLENRKPNKKYIGKNANVILKEMGIEVGSDVRLIVCEVSKEHPFVQEEMMMPVMPVVRVQNFEEGAILSKEVEHGYRHTAVIHSTHIDHLHHMACIMNCSIFVKNSPSYGGLGYGGEGYTSFTIASPTGEGMTNAVDFTRKRRCTLKGHFRIV
ncbi:MAG: aldehyde dehydrogenase EutE [Deltaproteobacteria bacterium]|nr:aldehyde dehydrogenase EutE [Deltaproteobacteria bacterium]